MTGLPFIKSGSSGPYVSYCQNLLNARVPGIILWVDGIFGIKTDMAVKRFQSLRNLKIDGKVGDNTWNALEVGPQAIKKRPSTTTSQTQAGSTWVAKAGGAETYGGKAGGVGTYGGKASGG